MIPKSYSVELTTLEISDLPSKTYKLDLENNRITGYTDELDAIKQAIYLILNTERYEWLIYSWDYGLAVNDLYGKDNSYVISEVQRRITEALMQDDRITSVDSFSFERNREKLHVTFTAHTIYGDVSDSTEVVINGVWR